MKRLLSLRFYLWAAFFFLRDLRKLIKKEISEPGFMPQEDYTNCGMRAMAMLQYIAVKGELRQFVGLAIIYHRMAKSSPKEEEDTGHDEIWRADELSEAEAEAPDLVIRVAQKAARGWWNYGG